MTTTRQRLRQLVKASCDLNSRIEEEDYAPLLNSIVEITKENDAIECEDNNSLMLKTGITRIGTSSLLSVLETKTSLFFNESELAQSLLHLVREGEEGEELNWLKLSGQVMNIFKSTYLPFPVQISVDQQQRPEDTQKVKAARVRKSTGIAETTVASKLTRFEGENIRALESVYNDILRSYAEEGQQPLPFYKLICDPTSFPKSVHNAFQLSFLIQSNLVRVYRTETGETMLEPADLNAPFTSQKGGDNAVHAVITLDYELWESTVSNYQIEESMING